MKPNSLLESNSNINSNNNNDLDIGSIYVKPKYSPLSFLKSNIFQLIIILISVIAIIVLSFKVNTQRAKVNKMQLDIEKTKIASTQLDLSIKDKSTELAQVTEEKDTVLKLIKQSKNKLTDLAQELESTNAEYIKVSDSIKNYQQTESNEQLAQIKAENSKLLKELSRLKIVDNGIKNERMKNKISEILSEEEVLLLELWTGKQLLFACFNTHIHPMSGRQFHNQCDMYSETITLVQLEHTLIGGYTSQDWRGNQDKYDDKAFIFNLKNKIKFNVRPGHIAICPSELDMPVFSKDIALTKDVNYVTFPHSYGTYEDKDKFGIDSTMIHPLLVEVIVVQ